MRFEIRTMSRAMSTLAVLCVLVFGASLDVLAHGRGKGRRGGDDRGRHLGWERGRRVGHQRRGDDDGSNWRRLVRRSRRAERRSERRERRRERRFERRSSWDGDRNWQRSRFRQNRADYPTLLHVRRARRF